MHDRQPVILIIFDGFGLNPSRATNGWALARTPHLDHYFSSWPHSVLQASGKAVGLPDGQFGNSEVGHLTLGAGRILEQDLMRIANAIHDGSLQQLTAWQDLLQDRKRLHLIGLVSDGGVHSHMEHLYGLLQIIVAAGVEPVVHMITDGRDTSPTAALHYLTLLEKNFEKLGAGFIATVCGRYHAMDRVGNWDRTEKAWKTMRLGQGLHADTPRQAIENAFARDESDEFIQATVIADYAGMANDEAVFFFNFRSDRARQLAAAIGLEKFNDFDRGTAGKRRLVTMTDYDATFPFPVLFKPNIPQQGLAEVISDAGLKQFHCAETEKYPHVTYFFNGGVEKAYPGEDRLIVPSAKVATYDQQPEMSAAGIADSVIDAIESEDYAFILVNFANGDMVGHTAIAEAIIKAVETLDLQGHRVIDAALKHNWRVLLTADHGNCDEMVDPVGKQPHTRHTGYPVPLLVAGAGDVRLGIGRGLADIAPTVLDLLDIPRPHEMTGRSMILKGKLI